MAAFHGAKARKDNYFGDYFAVKQVQLPTYPMIKGFNISDDV